MKNYFDFKNKNVLILGASSGFGRVYSKVMYGLGANVLSIARNFQRLKSLKKECEEESYNGTINIMKCDISSNKNVNELIKNKTHIMIGIQKDQIVNIDLEESINNNKEIDKELIKLSSTINNY